MISIGFTGTRDAKQKKTQKRGVNPVISKRRDDNNRKIFNSSLVTLQKSSNPDKQSRAIENIKKLRGSVSKPDQRNAGRVLTRLVRTKYKGDSFETPLKRQARLCLNA